MDYKDMVSGLIAVILGMVTFVFRSSVKRLEDKDKEIELKLEKHGEKYEKSMSKIYEAQEEIKICLARIETNLGKAK